MIYELAKQIAVELHAQRFPFAVYFGPELVSRQDAECRILIERDRDAGDVFVPVQGPQQNPPKRGQRLVGVRAEIYARSPFPGARPADHERLTDQVVDALFCALDKLRYLQKGVGGQGVTEARFLRADELERDGQQGWPGAVYRMRFPVLRAVFSTEYRADGAAIPGDGLPVGSAGGTANTVEIRRNADDPPEVVELTNGTP